MPFLISSNNAPVQSNYYLSNKFYSFLNNRHAEIVAYIHSFNETKTMIAKVMVLFTVLFAGCNGSQNKQLRLEASGDMAPPTTMQGTFQADFNGKHYEVPIECSYYEHDYFKFQSDKTDVSDTNGDGLVVSGFQNGEKLVLTIKDQDVIYSAPGIREWKKENNGMEGSGVLFEEGGVKQSKVSFQVKCQ